MQHIETQTMNLSSNGHDEMKAKQNNSNENGSAAKMWSLRVVCSVTAGMFFINFRLRGFLLAMYSYVLNVLGRVLK
jgi:hypothetical protein